jgi:hypothetical protein
MDDLVGNSNSPEALILITAPFVSDLCANIANAIYMIDQNAFASNAYFGMNPDESAYYPDWRHEFGAKWKALGYESKYGELDAIFELVSHAYSYVGEAYPLLEEVRQQFIDLFDPLRYELSNLTYIGPLRSYPARQSFTGSRSEDDIESWSTGDSAWALLRSRESLRERVNEWLGSKRLSSGLKLEIREFYSSGDVNEIIDALRINPDLSNEKLLSEVTPLGQEVALVDLRTATKVSIRDVGIGIAQVLPVLVQALGAEGKTNLIEQPELHLHPALQSELADVFIHSARQGNRFLLETHSEHLILRMMRRIRETSEGTLPEGAPELKPDEVAILYVESTEKGSSVRQINLDEEGQLIDAWPGGFFEEGFRERFA